jgi:hypothetical protein
MGRLFLQYVEAETVHCCAACGTHLAAHDQIVSKAFQGRHGRAFLFGSCINVNDGPPEKRLLLTGLHIVADIYCNACDTRLGWMYVEAYEEGQKYKVGPARTKALPGWHTSSHSQRCLEQEGKFILEKSMILKEADYKTREAEAAAAAEQSRAEASEEDAMMLDSADASSRGAGRRRRRNRMEQSAGIGGE